MTDQNVFDLELYNLKNQIEQQGRFISVQMREIQNLRTELAEKTNKVMDLRLESIDRSYRKLRWYDVLIILLNYTNFAYFSYMVFSDSSQLLLVMHAVTAAISLGSLGFICWVLLK